MKSKKATAAMVICLLLAAALWLNVVIRERFIETYTFTELEYRGYAPGDVGDVQIMHSYLNRILGYNEWRISVAFRKEPDVLFWFTWRDGKIVFQGVSADPMPDKEAILDYTERFKNGTLLK